MLSRAGPSKDALAGFAILFAFRCVRNVRMEDGVDRSHCLTAFVAHISPE